MNDAKRHDLYLECACTAPECTLRFMWYEDWPPDDPQIFLHYFLPRGHWWERLWLAVRYLFNRFPPYGFFGEALLEDDKVERLSAFVDEYLEYRERAIEGSE